nr:unnamed protein product [Callosobruchus analis]
MDTKLCMLAGKKEEAELHFM